MNCISETSVFGIVGTLPNKYTNYVMFGIGISGLLISCLRLLCLGVFPQNSEGYLHSTELYFAVAGGVLILCVIAQLHLMKHPLVQENLGKTHSKEGAKLETTEEFGSLNSEKMCNLHEGLNEKEKVNYKELMKNI